MFRTFASACFVAVAASMKIEELAQVGGARHTCSSAANINKMLQPDFKKWRNLDEGYSLHDTQFGHDQNTMYWADMGEKDPMDGAKYTWKRAIDFAASGKTLFGNGISTDDIIQGALGNCWFLSACSAIAEWPGRMEKVFLNTDGKLNSQGTYGVNFYALGVPHTVIVDDWLPMRQLWNGDYGTLFSNFGTDGSMWVAIIEKAFAKYHGNYAHIEGGAANVAVQTMTGAPYNVYLHNKITANDLWAKLVAHDANNDVMTCGSPSGSDKTTSASGLVQGHAFTLVGTHVLSNGVRLCKIRNPHGREHYHGDWSDKSPLWTPQFKAEVGLVENTEDGIFYMDIDNFVTQFSESTANYNNKGWGYDYFLMLNDHTAKAQGKTKHALTVVSEVDQDVWVTAHKWAKRDTSKSCPKAQNSIFETKAEGRWAFSSDNTQSFKMKAGGKAFAKVEHDFTNNDLPKDWSVVAHGNKGPVYVYHDEGLVTQHQTLDASSPKHDIVRPKLAAYDYGPFDAWAAGLGGPGAYTSKLAKEVHDDRQWVIAYNSCPDQIKYIWSLSFQTGDVESMKHSKTSSGRDLKDVADCVDNAGLTKCSFTLMPTEWVAAVLEPGFGGIGYGYGGAYV